MTEPKTADMFSEPQLVKLDIGCGKNPREGFEGVDILDFGQKHKVDLTKRWPWADNSVDELHCSHCLEHFESLDRAHVVNEMYRVLKPEGKATVIVPHGASGRAYGDPTHKWPPIYEFWFLYLWKEWREANAPHTNEIYKCNFLIGSGPIFHPAIEVRNDQFKQFAATFYKEAITDIYSTWTKK